MTQTVFVSYRRQDAMGYSGRLFDTLTDAFGQGNVFMDIVSILPGQDFREEVAERVKACSGLVALIGPDWFGSKADGSRRIDDDNDLLRAEIASALQSGIRVVPALIRGASIPSEDQLPDDLKPLARRQAVELTDSRWSSDVSQLIRALGGKGTTGRRRVQMLAGLAIGIATGLALILAVAFGGDPDGSGSANLDELLLEDSMNTASGGAFDEGSAEPGTSDCASRYEDGYHIRAQLAAGDDLPIFCPVDGRRVTGELLNSRTEVVATWTELPQGDQDDELGAFGVTCRSGGTGATGARYIGAVTTNGIWVISRQPPGSDQVRLLAGDLKIPGFTVAVGDEVALSLTCRSRGSTVALEFSVAGEVVGSTVDPDPLPPAGTGLIVWAFSDTTEASFRDFAVYG